MSLTLNNNLNEVAITYTLSDELSRLATEQQFSSKNKVLIISGITESSVYLTDAGNQELVVSKISRKGLSESFTQPSRNAFLKQNLDALNKMYSLLGFKKDAILEIGSDIIQDSLKQDKLDIKVSRTGDNELLIFRENSGAFNNILIDSDGDIEFIHIPIERENTYNQHFPFIDSINTFELVSKL